MKYALKRLIRGLGTSNINARAGFYAALVALLTSNAELSLNQLFDIVNTELQTSGSNSKSVSHYIKLSVTNIIHYVLCLIIQEKGEIYTSQVLTCGAILRSGLFLKGSHEEQKKY